MGAWTWGQKSQLHLYWGCNFRKLPRAPWEFFFKNKQLGSWWLTPVILASQEVEIRKIVV
jgi:hypothetical protein